MDSQAWFDKLRVDYVGSKRPRNGFSSGQNEPYGEVIRDDDHWTIIKTGEYSSKMIWKNDGIFGNVEDISLNYKLNEEKTEKKFQCPRGHTFTTKTPIVVAVEEDPEVNSGPVCTYCYVAWFKANVNAVEITDDT